ncbi:hypothetical protein [Propionivibrio dicarboxylicus]|uniref:Uncharacterized protein n=1 Tax=Propionivibrio dicarboxylicus TaxID=83767 RepID=A0A1G7WMS0_9RHOO|nr:hypothetical protein [Propionivibrio dicarboxylicus]SDG73295.1 hypothetical protein SAMN05660652_00576 [Propionivibrio dicarboxylicus]
MEKDTDSQIGSEPSDGFLRKVELASIEALVKLLGMERKEPPDRVHRLTADQETRLRYIENEAVTSFQGDLTQLEAALGMMRMGFHFGWKVLYIIHSKKTVRNYEEILNIRIREEFPEVGPSSYRSVGLNLALRYSNFWKVVGGTIKIPRRRDVSEI